MILSLEKELLLFLPISKASNSAQRHILLFRAMDMLYKQSYDIDDENPYELSQIERDLVRGFVAALVYEFVINLHIHRNLTNADDIYSTSLVECGKRVKLDEVKDISTDQACGLGISIRKASKAFLVQPYLEEVLDIVFSENPHKLLELKDIDKLLTTEPPSPQQNKRKFRRAFFKRLVTLTERLEDSTELSLINKRSPLNVYRLLLYIHPSFNSWNRAWNYFKNSEFNGRPDINEIFQIAAMNIRLREQDLESFQNAISSFDLNSRYIILGKLAQTQDRIVDVLVSQLPDASPPESLRIVNALIIAAHKNKKAVEGYLEVKSNRDKYPHALEKYALIGDYLDAASEEALKILLDEAAKPITKWPSRANDVPKPRSALQILNNLPDLEPKAGTYLLQVLKGTDTRKRIITVSLIFQNQTLLRGIIQPEILKALLEVASVPISLIESAGEINPLIRTLKEFAIVTAVQFALDTVGELQIALLNQVIGGLISIDDMFLRKLTFATEASSKINDQASKVEFILSTTFGNDKEQAFIIAEKLFSSLDSDEEKIPLLTSYVYESLLRGQIACLAAIVLKLPNAPSKVQPEVETVISLMRKESPDFFYKIGSYSFSPLFETDYKTTRNLLLKLEKQLNGIDTTNLSSVQDYGSVTTTEYLSNWQSSLSTSDPTQDTYITDILEKLQPSVPIDSPEDYLRYIDSNTGAFVNTKQLQQLFEHIARTDLGENIRVKLLLSLLLIEAPELESTIFDYLEGLLTDKSALVIAASLYVILELVEKNAGNIASERKLRLIKAIEINCIRPRPKNLKQLYGIILGIPASSISEVAHAVLYKIER